jgi:hypothetical protein
MIGVVAGPDSASERWLGEVGLPDATVIDPATVPNHCSLIVWLWNPAGVDAQRSEISRLLGCLEGMLQRRGTHLAPILVVNLGASGDGKMVLQRALRRFYARRLNGAVPRPLWNTSQCVLNGREATKDVILERGRHLRYAVTRWRKQLQRQAVRSLTAGIGFVTAYVLMILASIPWHASATAKPQPRPVLDWTAFEWRQHLDECRRLLERINSQPWTQLDGATRAQFTQYLRWLPVSLDVLQQRPATRQSNAFVVEIQSLLGRMEGHVKRWTNGPLPRLPVPNYPLPMMLPLPDVLVAGHRQRVREELLDNVFDPRLGTTELHRLASQFWIDERSHTRDLIRLTMSRTADPSAQLTELVQLLRERLKMRGASRVHAPPRKLAFLQELELALDWALKIQQQKSVTVATFTQPSTPSLVREALAGHP